MLAAVSSTPWTILASDSPAFSESGAPSATWRVDSLISAVISLAAALERSASLRTSSATTAKPRPCSPARAASIAAFRASRLVWLAISLMTWMMSLTCSLDFLMRTMASIACSTDSPPCLASCQVLLGLVEPRLLVDPLQGRGGQPAHVPQRVQPALRRGDPFLGQEVHGAEDPVAQHDREADARLQPAPARDRGAGAGLHLAQVGDEDQVAGLPRLAVEALTLAEPRLGRHAAEFLADRARILDEPEGLVVGVDLPVRSV